MVQFVALCCESQAQLPLKIKVQSPVVFWSLGNRVDCRPTRRLKGCVDRPALQTEAEDGWKKIWCFWCNRWCICISFYLRLVQTKLLFNFCFFLVFYDSLFQMMLWRCSPILANKLAARQVWFWPVTVHQTSPEWSFTNQITFPELHGLSKRSRNPKLSEMITRLYLYNVPAKISTFSVAKRWMCRDLERGGICLHGGK